MVGRVPASKNCLRKFRGLVVFSGRGSGPPAKRGRGPARGRTLRLQGSWLPLAPGPLVLATPNAVPCAAWAWGRSFAQIGSWQRFWDQVGRPLGARPENSYALKTVSVSLPEVAKIQEHSGPRPCIDSASPERVCFHQKVATATSRGEMSWSPRLLATSHHPAAVHLLERVFCRFFPDTNLRLLVISGR